MQHLPVALKKRPVGNLIFIHDPCLFQTQISFRDTLKSTQYLLQPSLIWRSFQKRLHWATLAQTYQAVEHLIKHCSQTPPVHCPVIRFPAENLWCQILQTEKGGKFPAGPHKPLIFLSLIIYDRYPPPHLCIILSIFSTHLWGPTESWGGSLWLNTFFTQPKICQHHVALRRANTSRNLYLFLNYNEDNK